MGDQPLSEEADPTSLFPDSPKMEGTHSRSTVLGRTGWTLTKTPPSQVKQGEGPSGYNKAEATTTRAASTEGTTGPYYGFSIILPGSRTPLHTPTLNLVLRPQRTPRRVGANVQVPIIDLGTPSRRVISKGKKAPQQTTIEGPIISQQQGTLQGRTYAQVVTQGCPVSQASQTIPRRYASLINHLTHLKVSKSPGPSRESGPGAEGSRTVQHHSQP